MSAAAAHSLLAVALASPGQSTPGPRGPAAPDIKGIVPPEPYVVAAYPWLLILVAVCVLLGGLAWWYFRRRRSPRPARQLTPRQVAERRLSDLANRAAALDPRTFGNEAADILRAYIGTQFDLRPERQTSQEFLASVAGSRAFTRAEHGFLADFLEGCDLLKFARADVTSQRKNSLIEQALEFVRSSAPPPLEPISFGEVSRP